MPMDIQIIRHFPGGRIGFVADSFLSVTRPDRTKRCGDYEAEKLYIIDMETRERREIAPDIPKFFSEDISYAQINHPYVMFTSAEETGEGFGKIRITLYRYSLTDGEITQMVSYKTGMLEFRYSVFFTAFVLDEDHVLIQREDKNIYRGTSRFSLYLVSAGASKMTLSEIRQPIVKRSGISRILPLSDEFAAVHFGHPLTEKDLTGGVVSGEMARFKLLQMTPEGIAIINIRQFFSELQVNLDNLFSNLIDSSEGDITYPYMRHSGKNLIYARYSIPTGREEIVIYDTEEGTSRVRMNKSRPTITELLSTYVIGDTPYLFDESGKNLRIINLDTSRVQMHLPAGTKVIAVSDDLVILHSRHKGLFTGGEKDFLSVYRFPDFKGIPLAQASGRFYTCIEESEKIILVFA